MLNSVLQHDWQFYTLEDPALVDMHEAAKWFCTDMKKSRASHWLTFCGASGTGKTHLARRCFAYFKTNIEGRQWVPKENHVAVQYGNFWNWSNVVNEMREGRYGDFEFMCDDWFTVIDDVGSERDPTKFATDKLLEILNQRRDKWTLITSNLFLDEIGEKMDVRLSSRLLRDGSKVVQNNTQDFNLRDKQEYKALVEKRKGLEG